MTRHLKKDGTPRYHSATPAERRRMRRLYDRGKTIREIQGLMEHRFSRGVIANYLHAEGGHVRPRGRRPGGNQ